MTALPDISGYTGSVTQGQKKAFVTALRGYLSGLFGDAGDKPYVDVIAERTPGNGVFVDGVLLKDSVVGAGYGGTGLQATLAAANHGQVLSVNAAGTRFELATPRTDNVVINGGFDIWQRGTNFTSGLAYTADRWVLWDAGGVGAIGSLSRQEFTLGQTDVKGDPRYYARLACTTAGSFYWRLLHRIEAVRRFQGTWQLSFDARASAALSLSLAVIQNFGTGGAPSADVTTGLIAQNLTTNWQRFTVEVPLPSVAGKTMGTNNNDYLSLVFQSPTAATFQIDIANVKLQPGPAATPFIARPYADELRLCQRYFAKSISPEATAYNTLVGADLGLGASVNDIGKASRFPVVMRAAPTVTVFAASSGTSGSVRNLTTNADIGSLSLEIGPTAFRISKSSAFTAGSWYGWHYNADAEL